MGNEITGETFDPTKRIETHLEGCARCRGPHPALVFEPISNPPTDSDGKIWSHWATCPVTLEPIMLAIVELEPTMEPADLDLQASIDQGDQARLARIRIARAQQRVGYDS